MEESIWYVAMKLITITTWNNNLYKEYAHRFEATYNWSWPYTVYNEDDGMYESIPDLKKFVERNKHRPAKDFLQDAVRFSYKVYGYCHAIQQYSDYDFIMGVDADSVFYHPMPEDVVAKKLYKEDCMMTYLGRPVYTECGFLYFNMHHQFVKLYAEEMAKMYTEDLIYKEKQQHDSWIWDVVRLRFEKQHFVKNFNIGDNQNGHVQARSILGPVYDHTKGLRKNTGKSPEART